MKKPKTEMPSRQELQVQPKRELARKEEGTVPARMFAPATDIFETDQSLMVVLEMPGVSKDSVEIGVENDVVRIEGRVDLTKYEGLRPVYGEYNIGHYVRSFHVPRKIDQTGIKAEMQDGVLSVVLPKAEEAKPRKIKVG